MGEVSIIILRFVPIMYIRWQHECQKPYDELHKKEII